MENKIRTIPLLPLRGILVFPYMIIHLDVGREKSISALEEAMLHDRFIMLAAQKDAENGPSVHPRCPPDPPPHVNFGPPEAP